MALIVDIIVVPGSKKKGCIMDAQQRLKCYLANRAEKGKANNELVALLATALRCHQRAITIISGATARKKRIKIDAPVTYQTLLNAFGIIQEKQHALF